MVTIIFYDFIFFLLPILWYIGESKKNNLAKIIFYSMIIIPVLFLVLAALINSPGIHGIRFVL